MNYLDTSVIVAALLSRHPQHQVCFPLVDASAVTSCHALAEAFNTLTGSYKVPNYTASEMLSTFCSIVAIEEIARADYLTVIKEARERAVHGGLIYDAIHAAVARRLKVERVFTHNATNFQHVAPDLTVEAP